MALSKDDRIAFSLNIVSADDKIKNFNTAQAQVQVEIDKLIKLDNANKNLFDPTNSLINSYQNEQNLLDGILRTTISESDIQNSAKRILGNYFFPNNENLTVPSLAGSDNIWIKIPPFALNYAIGKNYSEGNSTIQKEDDLISAALAYITTAQLNADIQNTTGQSCNATGTCSIPAHLTQAACTLNGGVWTPGPDAITSDATIQTLKTNLVNTINLLKTFLLNEVSLITLNDPNTSNQTLNNTAINNINNIIIPALNTWLAYDDFNTAHGQTTCAGFNSYNANLLAPTKLHSTQLAALQTALSTRSSFVSIRSGQVLGILGSISQNISTGELNSSSGLYGRRYGFLLLRIHTLNGSLSQLTSFMTSKDAQNSIKADIANTKNTYYSLLPTSLFKAPGNGTSTISLVDASFLSPGDTVYIKAEEQEEIQRAVKSVLNDMVVLNDTIPAKYRPNEKARLYKDIS